MQEIPHSPPPGSTDITLFWDLRSSGKDRYPTARRRPGPCCNPKGEDSTRLSNPVGLFPSFSYWRRFFRALISGQLRISYNFPTSSTYKHAREKTDQHLSVLPVRCAGLCVMSHRYTSCLIDDMGGEVALQHNEPSEIGTVLRAEEDLSKWWPRCRGQYDVSVEVLYLSMRLRSSVPVQAGMLHACMHIYIVTIS